MATEKQREYWRARSRKPARIAWKKAYEGSPEFKARRRASQRASYDSERRRVYYQSWRQQNLTRVRQKAAEYQRRRKADNPEALILQRLRCRLWSALRRGVKSASTVALIGCSPAQLRAHLEAQFKPGMVWGPQVHIDHIRPVSSFDLTDPEQQKACFHYTNLQPLWKDDNLAKRFTDKLRQFQQGVT